MNDSPKQRIAREREVSASAGVPVVVDDASVFPGSRSRPRAKKGAQVPADDVLELPDVIELTGAEVEAIRGHQRKALSAARRAVSFVGADHSHNVRLNVETSQREIRAAFDVLDRAVKRARKAVAS
jgi:hypothetical protein